MTCLFVGNLVKNLNESKFNSAFNHYGKCKIELKVIIIVQIKGPYAFVEYDQPEDANRALKDLNKTNLNGSNLSAKARIEYSYKKKGNDKLEENLILEDEDSDEKDDKREETKKEMKKEICFICKLPGHYAKDCILTRDTCYECGEKGHIAKECNNRVREAKTLTENRIKAILSQQNSFKLILPVTKINNIVNHLKTKNSYN